MKTKFNNSPFFRHFSSPLQKDIRKAHVWYSVKVPILLLLHFPFRFPREKVDHPRCPPFIFLQFPKPSFSTTWQSAKVSQKDALNKYINVKEDSPPLRTNFTTRFTPRGHFSSSSWKRAGKSETRGRENDVWGWFPTRGLWWDKAALKQQCTWLSVCHFKARRYVMEKMGLQPWTESWVEDFFFSKTSQSNSEICIFDK